MTCLINQKYYIGIHKTDNIFWGNPRCRLSELDIGACDDNKRYLNMTPVIKEEVRKYGKENFLVEAIRGAATREEAKRYFDNIVTKKVFNDPLSYNTKTNRQKY